MTSTSQEKATVDRPSWPAGVADVATQAPRSGARLAGRWGWLVAALGIAVSAVAAWLAFRGVDINAVGAAIVDAQAWALALGVVLILCSYPLLAQRWRVVAAAMDPPPARAMLQLLLIGTAVNNSFPLRLGEFVRGGLLARDTRRPIFEALGTVIVDRVADVVLFSVVLWATIWIVPTPGWVDYIALAGLALALLGVGALAAATAFLRRRPIAGLEAGRARRLLESLVLGFRSVRSVRSVLAIAGFTVAAWSIWVAGALVVSGSVGAHVSIAGMFMVAAIVGLGSALPSAPGFIGTYHWLLASGLTLQSVGADEALSAALLVHAAWFVPTTIVGITLALRRGLNLVGVRRLAAETRVGTA